MLLKLLVYTSLITTIYSLSELEELIFAMPSTYFENLLTASKNTVDDEANTDSLYDYKNSENLAKVIQDILFLHLKQNVNQPKSTTTTIMSNTINKLCSIDPKYCIDETVVDTATVPTTPSIVTTTVSISVPSTELRTTTAIVNVTQAEIETIKNIVKNEILLKLKAKTMSLSENNDDTSEKIYVYFIISIIFLSLLVLLLIIVLSVCCVIYYKQKARLDYYLNENYFTYFNNKHTILGPRGQPTFTLTETTTSETSGKLDGKRSLMEKVESNKSKSAPVQEERILKSKSLKTTLQPLKEEEEADRIEEDSPKKNKTSFRIMNKCKRNFMSLNGFSQGNEVKDNTIATNSSKTIINVIPETKPNPIVDDDEEDVVLEGDLGAINSLQLNLFSKRQPDSLINNPDPDRVKITKLVLDEKQKNEIKKQLKIETESTATLTESHCSDYTTQSSSTISNLNNNTNIQIAASPSVMRDRYYKLLREQVFPYLHRSIATPAKTIVNKQNDNNFVNDVLY
jgi:hypothetical protein